MLGLLPLLLLAVLGARAGDGAGSGAHEPEDAPLEIQQGVLLRDRWGEAGGPNEAAAWVLPEGAGAGRRYRPRKGSPLDRRRKYKVLRRPDPRPLADQPGAYVAGEALLGAAWLDGDDALHVRHRLQKLDFYFSLLRILSEDCRQRVLCEAAREPQRFNPLAAVLAEATSFAGSYEYVTSHLINTTEGARLLSYLEASFRGQDRIEC